jgi:regulator of protease activity HflC (stomatin/prohibitin superfamily)
MFKTLTIQHNERALLFKDGTPVRGLGPGKYRLWGSGYSEHRWNINASLLFDVQSSLLSHVPVEWYHEVTLGDAERGILFQDGKPLLYLRSGVHRYWAANTTTLRRWSTSEAVPEMTQEVLELVPKRDLLEANVEVHQVGLLYVGGEFVRTLAAGIYRHWQTPRAKVEVTLVDMRRRSVTVAGQDLMTRDKVTLRLTLAVDFTVTDAKLATEALSDLNATVYLAAQLAARDYVSCVTLDALLEGRDALNRAIADVVVPQLRVVGVRVDNIGVKDVVLPGEMKALLNRVIEAEKEAAANVILRREEVAATRSLANTARVMAEQPILLRLKELETMKEMAAQIKELRVVVGADSMSSLLPAQLLKGATARRYASFFSVQSGARRPISERLSRSRPEPVLSPATLRGCQRTEGDWLARAGPCTRSSLVRRSSGSQTRALRSD